MGTYLCGEGMLGSLGENGNTSEGEGEEGLPLRCQRLSRYSGGGGEW